MRDSASASDLELCQFGQALRSDGLDLIAIRNLAPLRDDILRLGLPLPVRANPLGVFIGNTRALWPQFLSALRTSPILRTVEDPLDAWVEERVLLGLSAFEAQVTPYFAHRRLVQGYVPLQHWAQVLGVFALSPSHLSVHPEYGPWLALRALVVMDLDAAEEHVSLPASEPCASCSAPCRQPFEIAARGSSSLAGTRRVTEHWQEWLAVRDACPFGRQHRYTEEQIRYHYARDRRVLDA